MNPWLEKIENTYGSNRLSHRLMDSLRAAGLDLNRLTTKDLLAFDELHIMGRQATAGLGNLAGLHAGMQVLDIGSGLGGPARTLAETFGCHVMGADLSAEFVQAAEDLSRSVGLQHKVAFQHADALALPFAADTFDAAVMIHLNMNIADKHALFSEALRVLKPKACLALWEICIGDGGPVTYPVPWADNSRFSHLVSMGDLREDLKNAGFSNLHAEDATDEAVAWVRERLAAAKKPHSRRPGPDLDLVLKNFRLKRANASKNLMRHSIRIMRALGIKEEA
jgi:ubiquinone/menaquinone biosynthesis C-methylase UbiE